MALAGEDSEVFEKSSFLRIENLFSSANFDTLSKRRGAKTMLIGWMESQKFYLRQPLEAVENNLDVEESLNSVLKRHSKLLLPCLDQIVEFLEVLLKYRFFKLGKSQERIYFSNRNLVFV